MIENNYPPVEECDVEDKESLREFRQKRTEWREMIEGRDPNHWDHHCIIGQL